MKRLQLRDRNRRIDRVSRLPHAAASCAGSPVGPHDERHGKHEGLRERPIHLRGRRLVERHEADVADDADDLATSSPRPLTLTLSRRPSAA